jgi:uncharacterized membrane protein
VKKSVELISFLQAVGLVIYISVVAFFMWNANHWFGTMNGFYGPLLVLSLFAVSALICALITFSYPVYLFWEEKKVKESLRVVSYTAVWLSLFVLAVIFILALRPLL